MKFRKKPVVIEAEQFDGHNNPFGVVKYHDCQTHGGACTYGGRHIVETLEGAHIATPGDWIIRGVKGEFYPCKPDIFEATYERVES